MARLSTLMYALWRAASVLFEEGPPGIFRLLKRRLYSRASLLVLTADLCPLSGDAAGTSSDHPSASHNRAIERAERRGLEFKQLSARDDAELDELTDLDPWKISKSSTVAQLSEESFCFVAKLDGHVVASLSAIISAHFMESYLQRQLSLGPTEAYLWRGFTAPRLRGRGFALLLARWVSRRLASEGRSRGVTWVRVDNPQPARTLARLGWRVVGRLGFIDLCGVRLHYLFGDEAFRFTRRRVFLQCSARR